MSLSRRRDHLVIFYLFNS